VLVTAALSLVVLSGCAQSPQRPAASSEPTPAVTAPPDGTAARAVYWLGATEEPRGPRLYREFLRLPVSGDPVRQAVEAMLTGTPSDPDYTNAWPQDVQVRDTGVDGDVAVVDLSEQVRRASAGAGFEAMSLQQLVHTVTAADPSVRAVRLLVEGEPVETLWGHVDTSHPLSRAPATEVLAPVWIDLAQGATSDGSFGGTAAVFEATVSWQVRSGDVVVDEGFSTASEGAPGRGEWSAITSAPPGPYEVWAYESSARDGSITWLDSKRVTIGR
jgi:hypothetical protein